MFAAQREATANSTATANPACRAGWHGCCCSDSFRCSGLLSCSENRDVGRPSGGGRAAVAWLVKRQLMPPQWHEAMLWLYGQSRGAYRCRVRPPSCLRLRQITLQSSWQRSRCGLLQLDLGCIDNKLIKYNSRKHTLQ